jgi:hypothetical protein
MKKPASQEPRAGRTTVLLLALLAGCARANAETPPKAPPAKAPASAEPNASTPPISKLVPAAAAALDLLDARAPVPLLPMMANHQKENMREHLEAVLQITAGLGAGDFAAVEKAAGRIGFSQQMGMMCTHMGAAAPGFTEQALAFHHTADKIGAAARAKDRAQVQAALVETLQTCTACHAAWKQQVVDEAEWKRLTGSGPPQH